VAFMSTRKANLLDPAFVLAPERYDPRREVRANVDALPLREVAISVRKTVESIDGLAPCLVLDTSDAREGLVISRRNLAREIGSTKKVFQVGDVIISRLRPYLRQVAYVDKAITAVSDAPLLCSTEFFVLRSVDGVSIAFLVPFLLSAQVQRVLVASQEGGHHPRIRESAILTLPIPSGLLETRVEASSAIESAAELYRQSERAFRSLIGKAEDVLPTWESDSPASEG
jgi:hypothetical protein